MNVKKTPRSPQTSLEKGHYYRSKWPSLHFPFASSYLFYFPSCSFEKMCVSPFFRKVKIFFGFLSVRENRLLMWLFHSKAKWHKETFGKAGEAYTECSRLVPAPFDHHLWALRTEGSLGVLSCSWGQELLLERSPQCGPLPPSP